jgi:hypothetical protein
MSRRHIGLVVVMVMVFLSFFALIALPTVSADVQWEESFSGLTPPDNPTGWSYCDIDRGGSANTSNDRGNPTVPSMRMALVSGGDGMCGETFTAMTGGNYWFGFYFYLVSNNDNSILFLRPQSVSGFDPVLRINADETVDIGDGAAGAYVTTGWTVAFDTWYLIEFYVQTPVVGQYDFYLNNSLQYADAHRDGDIEIEGFDVGHTGGGSASALAYFDWFSVTDGYAFTSTATTTGACNQAYLYQAATNASGEEQWGVAGADFLSINSLGRITGTPTAGGTFSITVYANISTSEITQAYTLTVASCGGGGFHRIIMGGGVWEHATYETDDEDCEVGELTIGFADTTVDPSVVLIYIWDFGDGSPILTSLNPNVTHTFPETGIYTVTHAVMISDGTTLRLTQEVDVGVCKEEVGEPFLFLLAGIIAAAIVLWLTYVLTRRRRVMWTALLATLIGVSGWSLLLGV